MRVFLFKRMHNLEPMFTRLLFGFMRKPADKMPTLTEMTELGTKFPREVPFFWEITKLNYNTV